MGANGPFKTHVVKCDDLYCRFESHNTVTFTDNLLGATLYSRRRDAVKRTEKFHYNGDELIGADVFSIFEVEVVLTDETDVTL